MDWFGVPDDHTPPATPPPSKQPRTNHRVPRTYLDLHESERKQLEYIAQVKALFQQLSSKQKHYLFHELVDCCDNDVLAYVQDLIAPRLKIDFLKDLPIELSLHVLSFIHDPRDLANAARVSLFWNSLLKDEVTWKSLCQRHRYRRRSSSLQWYLQKTNSNNNDSNDSVHNTENNNSSKSNCKVSYRDYFWLKYNTDRAWTEGTGQLVDCANTIGVALVTCLQVDDVYTVVGCDNHLMEVYDSQTGRHIRTLREHEGGVWVLQFQKQQDGSRILVSGGCDRSVCVWRLDTGELLHSMEGHTSTVRSLKVCDQGRTAVTGSRDATLRIWDLERGAIRHVCVGHQESVRCIAVHDRAVATGSYDHTARLWDLDTGQSKALLTGHRAQIYAIVFDGHRICTGSLDWTIRVWTPQGHCTAVLRGHQSLVGHLQLVPPVDNLSPPLLVSGGSDGCIRVWDLCSFECIRQIAAHDNSVSCLHANHKRILSGSTDGHVFLWSIETGDKIREFTQPGRTVWKLQFTDSRAVVVVQRRRHRFADTAIELHVFDDPQSPLYWPCQKKTSAA
ncbi:WD40-repeat-containing domain protein [Syncephalastrum racemosum]|uniref:WD40-repeat-containing domain protein n=1 Tax=Syncephalastrum racemosum TaxID=13706 RepID=A0A1X2HSM9_SYNRA|nr:WD40-repeat-containing domain protein [Syncephalastrum racemosum]